MWLFATRGLLFQIFGVAQYFALIIMNSESFPKMPWKRDATVLGVHRIKLNLAQESKAGLQIISWHLVKLRNIQILDCYKNNLHFSQEKSRSSKKTLVIDAPCANNRAPNWISPAERAAVRKWHTFPLFSAFAHFHIIWSRVGWGVLLQPNERERCASPRDE